MKDELLIRMLLRWYYTNLRTGEGEYSKIWTQTGELLGKMRDEKELSDEMCSEEYDWVNNPNNPK